MTVAPKKAHPASKLKFSDLPIFFLLLFINDKNFISSLKLLIQSLRDPERGESVEDSGNPQVGRRGE